jgi:hypothetical protein
VRALAVEEAAPVPPAPLSPKSSSSVGANSEQATTVLTRGNRIRVAIRCFIALTLPWRDREVFGDLVCSFGSCRFSGAGPLAVCDIQDEQRPVVQLVTSAPMVNRRPDASWRFAAIGGRMSEVWRAFSPPKRRGLILERRAEISATLLLTERTVTTAQ